MVDPEIVRQIRTLSALNWGSKRIARELGIARNTVRRYRRICSPVVRDRGPRFRRTSNIRARGGGRLAPVMKEARRSRVLCGRAGQLGRERSGHQYRTWRSNRQFHDRLEIGAG